MAVSAVTRLAATSAVVSFAIEQQYPYTIIFNTSAERDDFLGHSRVDHRRGGHSRIDLWLMVDKFENKTAT
jgi:hypothetical protein